jgi:hypothetical protein
MQVFDTLFQTSPDPHVCTTSAIPEFDVEKAFEEVPFAFATLLGVIVTTGTLAIATGSIAGGCTHCLSPVSQLFGATQFTQLTPVS